MKTKELIIIGVIVIICIIAGTYFLLSSNTEFKNITMNGITFEVPESDTNVTNQTDKYSIYNDSERNIAIFVFDSENSTLNDMSEAASFAATRDSLQIGAQLQQESNKEFNYSNTLNVYTYLTNYTHKNVFIVTKNKEDMLHILSSIDLDAIILELNDTDNDTSNNTTTKTGSTKSASSSQSSTEREEDKITPDGWNPKEHEVSRDSFDDGMEKVYYDDGYFRIVDSKGDVVTYGYGY